MEILKQDMKNLFHDLDLLSGLVLKDDQIKWDVQNIKDQIVEMLSEYSRSVEIMGRFSFKTDDLAELREWVFKED